MLGSVNLGKGSVPTAGDNESSSGGEGGYSLLLSKAVLASPGGASACTFAGAQVGDVVIQAIDLTGVVDANAFFEATVSVAGQVQQLAGFAGAQVLVPILLGRPA